MSLNGPIVIHAYQQYWPEMAGQYIRDLRGALDSRAAMIEHIGSTAVPGLDAKPIIDIVVGARPVLDEGARSRIVRLGYDFYGDEGVPGRGFFRREPGEKGEPAVHVHVFEVGHPALARDVRFRDALRADPALAHRYGVLKKALALQYRNDLDGYNRGKEDFIVKVAGPREAQPRWTTGDPVVRTTGRAAPRPGGFGGMQERGMN